MHSGELDRWLESKIVGTYLFREDGTIDVDGSVNFDGKLGELGELGDLGDLGISFGNVTGDFDCRNNRLVSLRGIPRVVGGNFFCPFNQLPDLSGAPLEVGGKFDCSHNPLASLEGFPKSILGGFFCETADLGDFLGGNLPDHFQKYVPKYWWEEHLQIIKQVEDAKKRLTGNSEGVTELVLFDLF